MYFSVNDGDWKGVQQYGFSPLERHDLEDVLSFHEFSRATPLRSDRRFVRYNNELKQDERYQGLNFGVQHGTAKRDLLLDDCRVPEAAIGEYKEFLYVFLLAVGNNAQEVDKAVSNLAAEVEWIAVDYWPPHLNVTTEVNEAMLKHVIEMRKSEQQPKA